MASLKYALFGAAVLLIPMSSNAQDLLSWNLATDHPWTQTETTECLIAYRADGLIIGTKTRNYPCAAWTSKGFPSHVRAETSAAVAMADENLGYGIGFARDSDGHYILFEVQTAGTFALYQLTATGWATLIPYTQAASYHQGLEAVNKLAVEINGTSAKLLLNDQVLLERDFQTDLSGDFVLFNNSKYRDGQGALLSTQVVFKNLTVSPLSTGSVAASADLTAAYDTANAGIALYGKDNTASVAKLRRAIAMAPNVAVFHDRLANTLRIFPDSADEAVKEGLQAVALAPDSASFHADLGYSYLKQKKFDEAGDAFQRAVARDAQNLEARRGLGDTRILQSRFAEAEAVLKPLAVENPGDSYIHETLAQAYRGEQKFAEAASEMRSAIATGRNGLYEHYWLGRDAYESGATEEAIRELKEAARLAPDDPSYANIASSAQLGTLAKQSDTTPTMPSGAQPRSKYGALAVDRSNGFYYGFSYDWPTLAQADSFALSEIQRRGGSGTIVVEWSGAGCAAYRTIDGNAGTAYGWGTASTLDVALARAQEEVTKRANGHPALNHVEGCNSNDAGPYQVLRNEPLPDVAGDLAQAIVGSWRDQTGTRTFYADGRCARLLDTGEVRNCTYQVSGNIVSARFYASAISENVTVDVVGPDRLHFSGFGSEGPSDLTRVSSAPDYDGITRRMLPGTWATKSGDQINIKSDLSCIFEFANNDGSSDCQLTIEDGKFMIEGERFSSRPVYLIGSIDNGSLLLQREGREDSHLLFTRQ